MTRARDVANLIGSGNYSSTTFTATAGQTAFTISHTQGFVQVFMNGLLLDETVDYTSNGSAVTLTSGAAAGDEIEVVAYNTFSVGDAVAASGGTFTGNVAMSGTLGVTGATTLTGNTTVGGTFGSTGLITASGGVAIGGTGADNTLDDYEEGIWTPTLARWTGGNISATYTSQNGRYTKIGRLVTLSFEIGVSAISSQGSSIQYIAGAPFNNQSNHDYDYAGTFGQRTSIPSGTVAMSCIKHATNNAILIREHDDFRANIGNNWEVGTMRGSITYEAA